MAKVTIIPRESLSTIAVDGIWAGDIKIVHQKHPKGNEVSIRSCPVFIEPDKLITSSSSTLERLAYLLLAISKLVAHNIEPSTKEQIIEIEVPEDDVLI